MAEPNDAYVAGAGHGGGGTTASAHSAQHSDAATVQDSDAAAVLEFNHGPRRLYGSRLLRGCLVSLFSKKNRF